MKMLLARVTLSTLLLCSAAGAAEIRVAPDGASIQLGGLIEAGDDAKLAQISERASHPSRLELSSLGGNVQAALAIGALVRRDGLETSVPERAVCASACGLVWLAGTRRAMGRDAHVGLHAAYLRRNGVSVETGAANALIGAYLSRLGFDDRAIVYLTSAAPDDMTWIAPADRQRFNIAFDSAPAPGQTPDPAVDAHLLSHPLALAGAIASAAVQAVDRLIGRGPAEPR